MRHYARVAAPGGADEGRVAVPGLGIGVFAVGEEGEDDALVAGGAGYG